MRSTQDMRLECLKMATTLATAKLIKADEVQHTAEGYFAWVDQAIGSARDEPQTPEVGVLRLKEKYR